MHEQIPHNPIDAFAELFTQAQRHPDINEPNALCLATVARHGRPSNRMVLLKHFDEYGFVFYTNSGSRKAQQIQDNQWAAMCFFWQPLGKQVRIEGTVSCIDGKEADIYFASRSRSSRIGAWASKQSQPMADMAELHKRITTFEQRWKNQDVPRPEYWDGYRLSPTLIELWTEGQYRLHQRIEYWQDQQGNWQHRMLFP